MDDRLKKLTTDGDYGSKADDALDLNALLHPAQAFAHPSDVVNDPDHLSFLTGVTKSDVVGSAIASALNEQRADSANVPDCSRRAGVSFQLKKQ
jgi:hypothetical protein